jgi:DNA-binding NarL/FixJ family response regulator
MLIGAETQSFAPPATVLIVDDHPTVREGLALRISGLTDLVVCGEVSDVPEAMEFVSTTIPDIAVVDITLKTGSGIDLIKHFKEVRPSIHILGWSMHIDSLYAERVLRAGAEGYINKLEATEHIIEAIRHILTGKIYLSEPMADQLLRRSIGGARQTLGVTPVETLSDRELETYRLIGEGLSTREIAQRMDTHLRTVETFLARIKRKFNFENRQQLVHAAAQWSVENQ